MAVQLFNASFKLIGNTNSQPVDLNTIRYVKVTGVADCAKVCDLIGYAGETERWFIGTDARAIAQHLF